MAFKPDIPSDKIGDWFVSEIEKNKFTVVYFWRGLW
jgi:hypothetical protein